MLTLHRRGKVEEWSLVEAARGYLWIYGKGQTALVPYRDVAAGKVRYVRFEKMEGVEGWVFVDLTD